jgi:hypothetical protein
LLCKLGLIKVGNGNRFWKDKEIRKLFDFFLFFVLNDKRDKFRKMKSNMKYSGQALAIVLVLLLVATIIGFALYARSIRESERLIGEKASAEANELVETVIGAIGMADYTDVTSVGSLDKLGCTESDLDEPEGCRKRSITVPELQDIVGTMTGKGEAINLEDFNRGVTDFCFAEIMMRHGLEDDEVVVEKDETYSISFAGVTNWDPPGGCVARFQMQGIESGAYGFVMSTFYRESGANGKFKNYEVIPIRDIIGLRYGGGGSNWQNYTPLSDLVFPTSYPGIKNGSYLNEVRFTAVGGSSSLTWQLRNCNIDAYVVMEVGATCQNRYVGKRFTIPSEPFAPSIFDYVLFNGEGELVPERIAN